VSCACEKKTVGGRELVIRPDPDCPRHGIRPGVMAVPHLRRHAYSGEDNRSTEARLYAEAGTRRSVLAVVGAKDEGGTMTKQATEDRSGRKHAVPETYVPTIHGEPAAGYLHEGPAPEKTPKKSK
jgi:hypothetical protein